MDISKSSATAELRGVGMLRRHRTPSEAARDPYAARLKAASLTACRGAWEFLKAVGEARARKDMLDVANSIAASRPELAGRLRRATRAGWAE